jgi:hypothetical protein
MPRNHLIGGFNRPRKNTDWLNKKKWIGDMLMFAGEILMFSHLYLT